MHVEVEVQGHKWRIPLINWPSLVIRLLLAGLYLFLSEHLTFGPRWLMLALVLVFLVPINVARWRGNWRLAHFFGAGLAGLSTAVIAGSAGLLLTQLLEQSIPALELLRDGAFIWTANILNFALWYWQIDAGGPDHRRHHGYASVQTDFLFPQMTVPHLAFCKDWTPGFLDYVFVAFTASTAFSPTDTLPLSQRVKVLMMLQTSISLVVIVVLVARAINTLG